MLNFCLWPLFRGKNCIECFRTGGRGYRIGDRNRTMDGEERSYMYIYGPYFISLKILLFTVMR
jgi:hypothetical protein